MLRYFNFEPSFKLSSTTLSQFKTEDVYEEFSMDKEMFDFSNYSTKSKYYNGSNELVVGKMKVETAGLAIDRSSPPEVFCKKDVVKNFAKLTGKHL